MTHQTKTQMHPADLEALKSRHDFLVGEHTNALVRAICHKAACHDLSATSADILSGYARALEVLADLRRAVEKQEREMRAAGL